MEGNQAPTPEANSNPFANSEVGTNGTERPNRPHVDVKEGWTFQGKKRHAPKLASPIRDAAQPPHHTPQRVATLGEKRS